jgi:hypothetical protein
MYLLLLILVIAAVLAVVLFRKQINLAYQERRLANAVKAADEALAGHVIEALAKAKTIIADAKIKIARLKAELGK